MYTSSFIDTGVLKCCSVSAYSLMKRDDNQKTPGVAYSAGSVEIPNQVKKSFLRLLKLNIQKRYHATE